MYNANDIKPNSDRDVLAKLNFGNFVVVYWHRSYQEWMASNVESYDNGRSGVCILGDVIAWCELPND